MDEPQLIMTTNIGSYNNKFTVNDNNEYDIFNHMSPPIDPVPVGARR